VEATQTTNLPNLETVWVDLQEVKQILKENAEARKETDRQM
jgi:hypothetical protein